MAKAVHVNSSLANPDGNEKIKVGISTCLLGENVRYDGGHQHDRYLTDTLCRYFEYVPVCPEVECGLSTPREAMRLVGPIDAPRLLTNKTGVDHTERMQTWAAGRLTALREAGLCGYIFKAKSPSSGLFHVKLYDGEGQVTGFTSGLWARAFTQTFPHLPVEEDGRLHDPDLRENFIERVFALKRFRDEVSVQPSVSALTDFHARNKLLLMAHAPTAVAVLGRLAAGATRRSLRQDVANYESQWLDLLAKPATVRRHVNVLQHMRGYFRKSLADDERQELTEVIAQYGAELVPLIVPVTLFRHYVRKYAVAYLADQSYLNPHPIELKLRNHA